MKRNAIIRIILWSLVIVILTTIMVGVGFGSSFSRNRRTSVTEATMIPVTIPPQAEAANAIVTATAVNVRKAPSAGAEAIGVVRRNDRIMVTRTESVNGIAWAYITSPTTGWVVAEYIEMLGTNINSTDRDVPQIQETMVTADTEGKNTFAANTIRELEIEWAAGDILIQPGNTDQITVKEDGVTEEKYAMILQQEGDTLDIRYCDESLGRGFGISFGTELTKDLTIYVPVDWYCESLEIDAASASVEVNDLTIGEVSFDGASGTCTFDNCTVEELDIDTASGDIRFVGSLNVLDCDAATANLYAVLTNVPRRLAMDMMSGDLELTLPADAGFTLTMDGPGSNFTTDFETTIKNGNQVCGDGSCRINIDALSGDVTIHKGE